MNFDTLDTEEKAQQFRMDRLKKIEDGKVLGALGEASYCILHWLPISKEMLFKTNDLHPINFSKFVPMDIDRIEKSNQDGVWFHSYEKDKIKKIDSLVDKYLQTRWFWNAQIFRSGALEIAYALPFSEDEYNKKWTSSTAIFIKLQERMYGFKKCMSHFDITAPIMVGVSLLHVLNYRFFDKDYGFFDSRAYSDKEQEISQMVLIKNLDNMEKEKRKIFDMLWQVFGYEKCYYYDECGKLILKTW